MPLEHWVRRAVFQWKTVGPRQLVRMQIEHIRLAVLYKLLRRYYGKFEGTRQITVPPIVFQSDLLPGNEYRDSEAPGGFEVVHEAIKTVLESDSYLQSESYLLAKDKTQPPPE